MFSIGLVGLSMKFAVRVVVPIFLMFNAVQVTNAATEPLPTYASGSAPDCPTHEGKREYRSNTLNFGGHEVYILGTSVRRDGKCASSVTLHIINGSADSTIVMASPDGGSYGVADVLPESSKFLVYSTAALPYPNEELRNVYIAIVSTDSKTIHWANAWDIFGWKDCDAIVVPQAFTAKGAVVIYARPSVMAQPRRQNCVADAAFFAVDLDTQGTPTKLSEPELESHLAVTSDETETCATDPDIVAACFTVRGRLSLWNGNPTARIWWIGTHHILGVTNEILPPNVMQYVDWDHYVYGDFRVCPFTKEKAGVMQSVCIDSATKLLAKPAGR